MSTENDSNRFAAGSSQITSPACQKALLGKLGGNDAKAAVCALVAISGREAAVEQLAGTLGRLVGRLAPPSSEKAALQLEAHLTAITTAVRLMPEVPTAGLPQCMFSGMADLRVMMAILRAITDRPRVWVIS